MAKKKRSHRSRMRQKNRVVESILEGRNTITRQELRDIADTIDYVDLAYAQAAPTRCVDCDMSKIIQRLRQKGSKIDKIPGNHTWQRSWLSDVLSEYDVEPWTLRGLLPSKVSNRHD